MQINISKVLFECKCGNNMQLNAISGIFSDIVHVPICLMCHSIRTQKRNIIDDSGRVNRFIDKYNL